MQQKKRKRSDLSRLRAALKDLRSTRTQLADASSRLSSAQGDLRAYEGLLADARGDRDTAITRANRLEARLTETSVELDDLRTAFRMVVAERDRIRTELRFALDSNDQLLRNVEEVAGRLRQMRALATVMAVKAVGDLAPADAAAALSGGAEPCEVNAEDVLAAANAVLPEAYRLSAKFHIEKASTPSMPPEFAGLFRVFEEMGITPVRV